MKITYPLTYRAVELAAYHPNILRAIVGLKITTKTLVGLPSDKLLIRMEAAPCNPSDIAFLQGGYNVVKSLPAVAGFEGCGIVVDAGEDLDGDYWVGRRVSCFVSGNTDGTWAEYFVTDEKQLLTAHPDFESHQAAVFFVNPFTAYALMDEAIRCKSKAVVINAAGSRLAEYLLALAQLNGIITIGIVRKEKTAEVLRNKGFDEVLVSTDINYESHLTEVIQRLQPTCFFDAVAGEAAGTIANLLPKNSQMIVYGGLSTKPLSGINAMQLIFNNLVIKGFDLNKWFISTEKSDIQMASLLLSALILEKNVENPISIEVGIEEIAKGIRHYLGSMSEGKMLIRL